MNSLTLISLKVKKKLRHKDECFPSVNDQPVLLSEILKSLLINAINIHNHKSLDYSHCLA